MYSTSSNYMLDILFYKNEMQIKIKVLSAL